MSTYRFGECPDLLRTALVELARSQSSPWFADWHYALANKLEWKPRIFTDATSCEYAIAILTAWCTSAHAIAKTVESREELAAKLFHDAVGFLTNLICDLQEQLQDLAPPAAPDAAAN